MRSLTTHQGDISYALEFHIPYYAIRRGSCKTDTRNLNHKPLRASRILPLALGDGPNDLYYYEAQLSFLVTGVDEWRYTSYCCVDTYFGSEPDHQAYLEMPAPIEPAAGGLRALERPLWNPREFFLDILSFRIEQAVTESQALVDSFEERMNAYVSEPTTVSYETQSANPQLKRDEALDYFLDDEKLSRTKELTHTVSTIQRFHDCYTRTIQAWEVFERDEIQAFDLQGFDALRDRWRRHLLAINGQIANLRSCTIRLHQHLVLFDGMKAGVSVLIHMQTIKSNDEKIVGASSLRESSASTRHSNFLRVLTLMTVVSTRISNAVLISLGGNLTFCTGLPTVELNYCTCNTGF
jgi:hypothetical protein